MRAHQFQKSICREWTEGLFRSSRGFSIHLLVEEDNPPRPIVGD